MAYAIIEISGRQYRVEKGESIVVDRVNDEPGAKLSPRALLFADGSNSLVGAEADKVKVEAVIAEHMKGDKVRVFKYRPKKRYKVTQGHRSELTKLEITSITAPGGTRSAPAKKAEPSEGEPADKKPAAKPAAKKVAKKAAAKKSSSKQPAPRKSASKKGS